jgi:ABC-type glycerol-3-phosphate transport system substrate-binding protein
MKTIFSRLSLILSLAIVLTACGGTAATIPAVTPSQSMPLPADLRDF